MATAHGLEDAGIWRCGQDSRQDTKFEMDGTTICLAHMDTYMDTFGHLHIGACRNAPQLFNPVLAAVAGGSDKRL